MGTWSVHNRRDSQPRFRIAISVIKVACELCRGYDCLPGQPWEFYRGRWLLDLGLALFVHDEHSIESPRDDVPFITDRSTTYR